MKKFVSLVSMMTLSLALAACGQSGGGGNATAAKDSTTPKLGIRPTGDETVSIDKSKIHNADLTKIYDYIDGHIDEHVVNLQKWIQQPSISNTGEGIQESAEMVKGFFDQLGCQKTQVYDVGKTKWGQQGNPVVYAKCDEGAKKTLVVYWMYDTMPVTQPDLWKAPPFEGRLVEQAPYKKVLIGRGATNSKGPEMAMWNALMSIKAVTGKLPVNLIFIAEGDEERMSMGYNKFVTDHPELIKGADAMYTFGFQQGGSAYILSGSEGCVFVELKTSGKSWGRGPVYSDIHGGNKRSVDSPAWRHIQMLSKLVSEDGNKVLIPGFYDNMEPIQPEKDEELHRQAKGVDMKKAAEGLGVARFISDDPYTMLKMARYGTSMNLDGIWGGNMFAGGSGAILPNQIISKHNFRYIPNMTGPDIVNKLRKYLDQLGYKDVEINVVGDVPWAKRNTDNEIGHAVYAAFDQFGISHAPTTSINSIMGGYWPAYLFAGNGQPFDIPIVGGMLGAGGNAHAANEYYVIEGAGKVYGMAGAEKSVVAILYNYAGLNGPIPTSSSPAK
ncbi:M20/M25/M40 family metallo-hydrolase [Sphingomonas sp.]|uniref:M20/M25/M40 family metallo-hydrolase n=1 Tax=Sphingomonas sp. TaxID=28214 RepID=UPI0025F82CFE|nr:M20/M25/M40 family metallo-hydrolase [Sphingomonas sp.]